MDELITRFKIVLDAVDWFETPNGETFLRDNGLWANVDTPESPLTTNELAARCAREESDNNENERSWGYGE